MSLNRRDFIVAAGLGATSATLAGVTDSTKRSTAVDQIGMQGATDWEEVREQFNLDPNYIHMAGLLIASHPTPVQEAITQHRSALNENPGLYLPQNNSRLQAEVRQAAARYMGVQRNDIALTDSTTMGFALVINGIQIREDQEMVTADFDYYSTDDSLRYLLFLRLYCRFPI